VTISIFAGKDTINSIAEIYLAYPPEQISKKIYKFEIRTKGKMNSNPIILPASIIKEN